MTKNKLYSLMSCSLVLGILLGWFIRTYYISNQASHLTEIRENNSKYKFINPLLIVDSLKESNDYTSIKKIISDYVNSEINKNGTDSISVYFRNLNTARWIGVNENSLYDPSSMLKVAVLIGYYKASETNPNIFNQRLSYTRTIDSGQNYKPEHPLETGSHTIKELLEAMIIDSDNTALSVLYNNDREDFVAVLKNLQIPPPPQTDVLDFMSPKNYSEFFRTLYSSTYLTRDKSEEVLELLSKTNFKNGLVGGIPESTMVAHKFGEHTTAKNGIPTSHQLHDCGIIYYKTDPYFLCIMTRGQKFENLETIIKNISSIVYKNIAHIY